jgi:hypothetical protein
LLADDTASHGAVEDQFFGAGSSNFGGVFVIFIKLIFGSWTGSLTYAWYRFKRR